MKIIKEGIIEVNSDGSLAIRNFQLDPQGAVTKDWHAMLLHRFKLAMDRLERVRSSPR